MRVLVINPIRSIRLCGSGQRVGMYLFDHVQISILDCNVCVILVIPTVLIKILQYKSLTEKELHRKQQPWGLDSHIDYSACRMIGCRASTHTTMFLSFDAPVVYIRKYGNQRKEISTHM
jgi:hypothetical protein